MNSDQIIDTLFNQFEDIRYVALYFDGELVYKQKDGATDTSAGETDRYEELLVNPTLLKLASQRGNIDCGGLRHLIIGYGNFNQLVRSTSNGHFSVCLDKNADLNSLPEAIFRFVNENIPDIELN